MKINLNRPHTGLLIPAGIWASEINFSSGGICLVITSELFYEKDYIRDYQFFMEYIGICYIQYLLLNNQELLNVQVDF